MFVKVVDTFPFSRLDKAKYIAIYDLEGFRGSWGMVIHRFVGTTSANLLPWSGIQNGSDIEMLYTATVKAAIHKFLPNVK